MSKREHELVAAMIRHGYECVDYKTCVKIRQLPIPPWISESTIPYTFRSIQGAADHLCPIIKDPQFTELVAA